MRPTPGCLDDEILKHKIWFKSIKLLIQQHSGHRVGNRCKAEYKFGQERSNFIGHTTQVCFPNWSSVLTNTSHSLIDCDHANTNKISKYKTKFKKVESS